MAGQQEFLKEFFRDLPDGHFILLWTVGADGAKTSHWANCAAAASSIAARLSNDSQNLYFGVASRRQNHGPHERGKIKDTSFLFGLWLDIDIQSDSHAKQNLPEDMDEAMSILEAVPLEPSIVVNSGHGIQAYWLLDHPIVCGPNFDRTSSFTKRFNDTFNIFASKMGWGVDAVSDLTRVMRVPGSKNIKNRGRIEDVQIVSMTGARYSVEEIEEYIIDTPVGGGVVHATQEDQRAVVDVNANPNFEKFEALSENHPDFRDRWTHKKPPGTDDSMSSYDMSIATIAAHSGWTLQEIVDLLAAHRRKYPSLDKQNKADRTQYLVTTASKALASARAKENVSAPAVTLAVGVDGDIDITDEKTVASREQSLRNVSTLMGIEIVDFAKYDGEDPSFRIQGICSRENKPKWFEVGTIDNLLSQAKFKARTLAHLGKAPARLKQQPWEGACEMLVRIARVVQLADGGDEAAVILGKLSKYIKTATAVPVSCEFDIPDDDDGTTIVYRLVNDYYFTLDAFCSYLRLHERENVSRKIVAKALKTKGVESKSIGVKMADTGRPTRRNMWIWKDK